MSDIALATARAALLVVDDTPENLHILHQLLTEQGYRVHSAPDGVRALNFAHTTPPDLILLDVKMPEIDGYQVCERLKADERTRDIPVIFLSALHDVSDKIKAFQVGGVDYITKPFQVEEVLARVATHLTLRQLQKDLDAKNAAFEKANEELRDFAHIVSHDLKAPLRGITQLVDWLVHDYAAAFDDQGKTMADLLCNRAKRLTNLIDGILQYSRAGRSASTTEMLDLNQLITDVLDALAPPDTVQVVIEAPLPTVVGDRIRLFQVFQNLLSNAIKFMDQPAGIITIGCAADGAQWRFSVADNGPGIAPQHCTRIFQIFQTLHHDDETSTGIGLAIVKKIVERAGGKVWVESTPGEGSMFFFTLPKTGEPSGQIDIEKAA